MERDISEADWKVFRQLREVALERFCERVLNEVGRLAAEPARGGYDRFVAVFELIHKQNNELARAFDKPRRSVALLQLVNIQFHGLLTDAEFGRFSAETRQRVDAFLGVGRS